MLCYHVHLVQIRILWGGDHARRDPRLRRRLSFPNNFVSVIDTATNTVVATIPVGVAPNGVAITPDGSRAYVTNDDSDSVSVIDTTTSTVVATIPVGVGPVAVAITPMSPTPTDREQCKDHGYSKFGPPAGPFKNQGQCVSYVEHH